MFPHIQSLFSHLPEIRPWIDMVLYDSACGNQALKDKFEQELNIKLKTSLNPRRRKPVTQNLLRGMEKITPYGNVVCKAGFDMDYKGMQHESTCCPLSKKGRVITIAFDTLPQIDPEDPPMAKRFKAMMSLRPSVKRMND